MKRILLLSTAAFLSLASVRSAEAQAGASATPATPATPGARDSLAAQNIKLAASADSALRDLERAAAGLARAVQETIRQTADNPELRITAMKLAAGAVAIAQQTLIQNADVLERILAEASRHIAAAQAAQEARAGALKQP